jgi:hypothetical protein
MTKMKILLVALAFSAAFAVVPSATAQCPFNYANPSATPLPCVHYMSAGSSAMYQGFAVSVYNEIAPALIKANIPAGATGTVLHFTTSGTDCTPSPGGCADGGNAVSLVDGRDSNILPEQVTYWVVWVNCTGGSCGASGVDTDVWAYNQVDSTVGDRSFMAQNPKVVSNVGTGATAANGIAAALLGGTADQASIPTDVYNSVNNHPITTGMTDIRAEDALYATARTNCNASNAAAAPYNCLGYQPNPNAPSDAHVAYSIISAYTSATANPVDFGLPGTNDPITGTAVPKTIVSFAVGEDPVVFFDNRSNAAGLGSTTTGGSFIYTNLTDNSGGLIGTGHGVPGGAGGVNWLGYMYGGNDCAGDNAAFNGGTTGLPTGVSANFAVHLMQREALSGTMNTTEFSAFDIFGGSLGAVDGSSVGNSNGLIPWTSQEANIPNPVASGNSNNNNPLQLNCVAAKDGTTGDRHRVIGASQMEKGTKCPSGTGGVCNVADSLGYNFWSFGNFSAVGNQAGFGYLALDGVDPLYPTYTAGLIPTCTAGTNCDESKAFPSGLFPHLVDGTYRAWSLLRAYCDPSYTDPVTGGQHCTAANDPYGTECIIATAQSDIGNDSAISVADYLPFQDPAVGGTACGATTTSFGQAGYGLARFVRSHYVFNPGNLKSAGVSENLNPSHHINATSGWDGPLPISVTNGTVTDVGVNFTPGGTGACSELGGDAGGSMEPIAGVCSPDSSNAGAACDTNSQCTAGANTSNTNPNFCEAGPNLAGQNFGKMVTAPGVISISKYLVAPTNHLKFTYTQTCGVTEPVTSDLEPLTGVCTGGANNGQVCITATAKITGAPAGAVCVNSPGSFTTSCSPQGSFLSGGSGMSLTVNGVTTDVVNGAVNGVFQITKIVSNTLAGDASSAVKVKMSPDTNGTCSNYTTGGCSANINAQGTGTFSTGSSQ